MRRWLAPAALAAAVAVSVLAVLLVVSPPDATSADRADALARELRCPDCQGLSVADSPTGAAEEIRRQIDEMLAAGSSPDDVRAHFVARYGDWILLAPSWPAAWAIPIAVVGAGVLLLVAWLTRSPPTESPARPTAPADPLRRRVRDEAEALDA